MATFSLLAAFSQVDPIDLVWRPPSSPPSLPPAPPWAPDFSCVDSSFEEINIAGVERPPIFPPETTPGVRG